MNLFVPNMRTEEILDELRVVLNSGWIGLGPRVEKFENEVAKHVNANHAAATSSCTGALQISLKALQLEPGSIVATTPVTFVSTNHAILHERLRPLFLDVNPLTGNISVDSLKEAIKHHKISCLIPVHLGGYPCDLDEINTLCLENGITVIEDCAHAFGASYKGKMVGSGENTCCWSFQAVKNMPIGDGGALTCNDADRDTIYKRMRWMGIDKDTISRNTKGYKWEYDVKDVGFKYFMNDIAATIGSVQIKYINQDNTRRKEIADLYRNNLTSVMHPAYEDNRVSSYHFYPVFLKNRMEVYDALTRAEIFPGIHYKLNTRYRMYDDALRMDLTGAHEYERTEITLPIHTLLSDDDVMKVVDIVNKHGQKS